MAEQLGQASLELTVDLEAFRRGLQEARRLISGELNDVRVRPQRQSVDRAQEQRTATNARAAATAEDRRAATRVITRNLGERLNRLEERGLDVARARAALGRAATATDQGRLETARSLNRLAREFVTLEERRSRGARTPQGGARESVQALAQAQDRRFRLSQRINRLEEQGTDVSRLRTRLGELTTSYAQRQFGSARQLSRELGRQVTLSEARLRREREIQRVTERNARLGGASEPIRGRVGVAGSPQDISAQIREGLRLGRLNASPVTGRTPTGPIPGSPADKEQQRRAQERQLREQARADRLREAAERRREQEQRRQQAAAVREQKRQETERARAERAQRAEAARAAREEQRQRVDALREQRIREQEQRQADRRRQAQERVNQQNERRAQQEQQRQQRLQQAEAARRAREERAAQDAAAREQRQRDAEAKRIAKQNSSPISGRLPGGVLIPGSPAFKEREQQLAQRRLADEQKRVAREQLQQQREQQRAQEQAARTEQRAQQRDQREAARLEGQRQREQERRQRAAAREEEARQARARREEERQQLRATREAERQADRKSKQRQKQQGFGDTRLGSSLGDALIGGAFPLLFGQGLGASIGGAAGGGLGGLIGGNFGFGLSLVGTAVGQQFDVAIQKVKLLGDALSDPISKFQELASAGLISSKSQETLIANLIKVGREAEAQALIQQDLAQNFGDLSAAKELAAATDELYRAFAQLTTLLANLAGPVLTGAIQGLTGLIRKYAQIAALDPERVKARERQATDIVASQIKPGQGSGFFGAVTVKFNGKTYKGSATGIREQIIRELLNQEVENATRTDTGSGQQAAKTTKELQEILNLRKQIKDAVNAQIVADSDGNKNESLRLQRLQVELNLQKELAKYNDSNDPGGVLREEARARAAEKLLKIDQELAKRPQAGSLGNVREELQTLQDLQNRLPVTSQAFAAVDRAIVRTTDALRGLEGAAAKVRFDSIQQGLDTGVIARSLTNLREQLQAAQTVVDNLNWDQLLVDPTAADQAIRDLVRVQDAVRKVDKQQAEVTVRVLGAEMATGTIAKSFNNLRDQLNAAQTVVDNFDFNSLSIGSQLAQQALNDIRALQGLPPLALDVGREKLAGAILDLVKIQDQINKIDGTKAQVTIDVLQAGVAGGLLTNNIANQRAIQQAAQQAFDTAPLDSPEALRAAGAYLQAGQKLEDAGKLLSQTPKQLAESAEQLKRSFQDAVLAQQSLVGTDQGLNAFLPGQAATNRQAQVNAQLQEEVRALKRQFIDGLGPNADPSVAGAVNRREFSGTLAEQNTQMIQFIEALRKEIRGGDDINKQQRDLVDVQGRLAKVNEALLTSNESVATAMQALSEKNWTVNVNVPGGSASGDVVGAVNSRS